MRVRADTEANCDSLVALFDRVKGYPKRGVNVGGGRHVVIPPTWNGVGEIPLGWTKHYVASYVSSPTDAIVQLEDDLVTDCAASSALNASEKAQVSAAAAARSTVTDPTNNGSRSPKAEAALAAAKGQVE